MIPGNLHTSHGNHTSIDPIFVSLCRLSIVYYIQCVYIILVVLCYCFDVFTSKKNLKRKFNTAIEMYYSENTVPISTVLCIVPILIHSHYKYCRVASTCLQGESFTAWLLVHNVPLVMCATGGLTMASKRPIYTSDWHPSLQTSGHNPAVLVLAAKVACSSSFTQRLSRKHVSSHAHAWCSSCQGQSCYLKE